jgi:ribosome-associated toxin RatA of RatAB toxin-antitoxin module
MRHVSRSAIVPYTAEQMFALVDDVEAYPSFLPWCNSTRVHSRDESHVEATLGLHRAGISKSFRTRNVRQPPDSMSLQLINGPFRKLEGEWRFRSLGDEGSKVSLDLDFQFENRLTDLLLGPFFEETCNSLVDAFTRRAHAVYGDRGNVGT